MKLFIKIFMNNKVTVFGGMLLLMNIATSVSALEYQAVTKHTRYGTGINGRPAEMITEPAVDAIDLQACQVITDNINEMEQYHVNWDCNFPISANNYLLGKPQWAEVIGEDKIRAVELKNATMPAHARFKPPLPEEKRPIYTVNQDVGGIVGEITVYILPVTPKQWQCEAGHPNPRTSFWVGNKNSTTLAFAYNLSDRDPVSFSSRIYFIEYNRDGKNQKNFWITTFKGQKDLPSPLAGVCAIKPTE